MIVCHNENVIADKRLHLSEPGSIVTLCGLSVGQVLRHLHPAMFGQDHFPEVGNPPEPEYDCCPKCKAKSRYRLHLVPADRVPKALLKQELTNGDLTHDNDKLMAELRDKGIVQ